MSAPLAKTDEIVLIGGQDRTTSEVSKLVGTLPPAVQALTGVDITGVGRLLVILLSHLSVCLVKPNDALVPVAPVVPVPPVVTSQPSLGEARARSPPRVKLGSFHMH